MCLFNFQLCTLTLLHSERQKLYTILVFLSAIGLNFALTCFGFVDIRLIAHCSGLTGLYFIYNRHFQVCARCLQYFHSGLR